MTSGDLAQVDSPQKLRALPPEQLPALCQRLREEIISVCQKHGGHLGASLGAVELIVALHRAFKSPNDALVFDVGHQAYAHKLLTGRWGRMDTLRQEDGVAPFLDAMESEHDAFGAGHACTAVSAALGILEGKALRKDGGRAVAIIGDGSLTGGMTFEALNNAGASRVPLLVVLNDNQMSISVNVGSIPAALRTKSGARAMFESMGFSYLGPVDGHDVAALEAAFAQARGARKPMVVHALTQKGKGFPEAEADAMTRGHAMGPYEWRDGKLVRQRGGKQTYSEAFAAALAERMAKDPKVAVVTPAMLEGSALTELKASFPERVFDVGIAEQHAVTFGAGLARAGMRPVCCLYSTFLQRAYDQVVHDVCLQKLGVVFAVDRAGLVGADGATHQGAYDASFLRPLPGMVVSAPVYSDDLGPLLDAALAHSGPWAIRFPRGTVLRAPEGLAAPGELACGKARWLKRADSPTVSVAAFGTLAAAALEAAADEPRWSVLDGRFAAPVDRVAILEAASAGRLVVVEEGTTRGGFGSAVLEVLADAGASAKVKLLGLPDEVVRHGDARQQRARLGLDAAGIHRAALGLL